MESTELYHMPLYNYFSKNDYKCYIINPIHTKNFAKQSIRKVKNDKVNSLRNLVFPKFNEIFSDAFSSVPLAILFKYPTYSAFLSANKSDVIAIMTSTVSHSTEWVNKRYKLLLQIAKEAELLKLDTDYLGTEMVCFINGIKSTFQKILFLNVNLLSSNIFRLFIFDSYLLYNN
ncbi:MAG: hypothetical protein A370_05267 [Clostridium sp. Maddingley MBC34-26]|nr:MAG: hypothetical protein A370_05267 [Clostridium sp. Maddingley MBC34-26]